MIYNRYYSKTGCNDMGMCCEEDTDWVKKCMEYEVEGSRPRGRPQRTWREVVQKRLPSKQFEQGGCYGSWYMEEAHKDWMMIRMVGGQMFLRTGSGSPG